MTIKSADAVIERNAYDALLAADRKERLRQSWIKQSIERALSDPSYVEDCCDPVRNPAPSLDDLRARSKGKLQ